MSEIEPFVESHDLTEPITFKFTEVSSTEYAYEYGDYDEDDYDPNYSYPNTPAGWQAALDEAMLYINGGCTAVKIQSNADVINVIIIAC